MADYDKLTIKIVANTGVAIDSIDRLSSRLDKLQKESDKMDFSRLRELQKILQDISNLDFNKASAGLWSLAESFNKVSKLGSNLEIAPKIEPLDDASINVTKEIAEGLDNVTISAENATQAVKDFNAESGKDYVKFDADFAYQNELRNLAFPKLNPLGGGIDYKSLFDLNEQVKVVSDNFIKFDANVKTLVADINGANASFEELGSALAGIGLNGTQIESVLKTIGKETKTLSSAQIREIEKTMKELGYDTEQVKYTIDSLNSSLNKSSNNIGKVALKLKSLALYRVLRLALMKIQQEFSQSIQQLAQFDPAFNKSISELSSSFSYLANSIVSSLAPILETLTPIISGIIDGLATLISYFGQMLGASSKATKQTKDYAESLKKVKSASLGIDELNIIQKDEEQANPFESISDSKGIGEIFEEIGGSLAGIAVSIGIISAAKIIKDGGTILSNLKETSGVILLVAGAITTLKTTIDIFEEGVDLEKIIKLVTGLSLAITGLALKFGVLGVQIGAIVGIVALLVTAWKDFHDAWGDMGTWQKIVGALALVSGTIYSIAAGIMLLTKNFAAAAIIGAMGVASIGTAIAMSQTAKNGISFATGGFPEDGFFFANHNELVGKFDNGKTAVANNEQITQGIHDAVLSAIQEGGNVGSQGEVVVKLDSREIARAVNKVNDRGIKGMFVGGKAYGY